MNPDLEFGCGILITEDHQQTATMLERLLVNAFPEHRVCKVSTAEDALQLCRSTPPQVVIMDITLPGMNGIEAMRQIKSCNPAIQVVMHTNLAADVYVDECMNAGASAYVLKDCDRAELIPTVARLLAITA